MISRENWNALTPQQQYDYVQMLEDTVDSDALEGEAGEVIPLSESFEQDTHGVSYSLD